MNKAGLIAHQRNAKYCLENRGEKRVTFDCDDCEKSFSEKRYLEKHKAKCNSEKKLKNLEEQLLKNKNLVEKLTKKLVVYTQKSRCDAITIEKLEQQVATLQARLENIAVQGVKKSTTTNNILSLQPLTKEWLQSQAMLLTDDHLAQGVAGLAQFAADNSFKNRVVCTDANRKSLRFKEQDGTVSKDPKGKKLSKMFFESIKSQADDMIPDMIENIKQELDDVGEDPSVFEMILGKMNDLINVEKGIKQISKGQEHQMKEEFTRELCALLPNP